MPYKSNGNLLNVSTCECVHTSESREELVEFSLLVHEFVRKGKAGRGNCCRTKFLTFSLRGFHTISEFVIYWCVNVLASELHACYYTQ